MLPYLQVENLSKRFGDLVLFENISFTIGEKQKVALIAKNGTGKSSLLNILGGNDTQDEGKLTITNDIKIGYLSQNPEFASDISVIDSILNNDTEEIRAIKAYEAALQSGDSDLMSETMQNLDRLNAWDYEVRIKQILTQLKITNFDQTTNTLSGGQKKRIALAQILISEPDMLILDEPTNHLDLEMIEWLEDYLKKTNSTLLMVTHDRYFLDRVCTDILEMDNNTIFRYQGNYSYFLEKREERIQQFQSEVAKAKNLLRTELEWLRRMPKARGHKAKYRVEAVHQLKEVAAQRMDNKQVQLNVSSSRIGQKVIEIDHISKSFDDLHLIKDFNYKFARLEKVGIVGNNGTGKSTLLNMLTQNMQPDKGSITVGPTVKFGYYKQEGINFNPKDRVIDAVREISEVVYMGDGSTLSVSQFLNYFLFPPETQYNYIEKLSGGEQRRLFLCTVLMQNPNFLILDEPTNDLDIMTLNVLEDYLRQFPGCVIIVSHDRYFMDKIVDHLFVFEGNGQIKDYPGNYSQYRSYLKEKLSAEKAALQEVKAEKTKAPAPKKNTNKLSYKEKRELEQLTADIEALETEKAELEALMNSAELNHEELLEKSNRYAEVKDELDEKEFRWLELSEKE
ncbi:ABC transporter ATP-binding protein [Prolixibacteraceae bacterium JC049]|nr:ABC transporter ATP-binding protein [Prolixibacteraceae bacterium JC049]